MAVGRGERPEKALAENWALLDAKGRAFASAIVYETIRHGKRIDNVFMPTLRKKRLEPGLRIAIRMALAELMFLREPHDYNVVNGVVGLAKKIWPGREGLVNAVLRNVLRGKTEEGVWPSEPTPANVNTWAKKLAIFYSHPLWLAERLVADLGDRGARSLMAANNRSATSTLRINPLKTDREALASSLGFPTSKTAISPWGLIPDAPSGNPERWPGFREGRFIIQDEASQILGMLMGEPGSILDCCAGLGGKTLAMATLAPKARIVAVDHNLRKLQALKMEADRLQLPQAVETVASELQSAPLGGELFDLVVVDAPCTGLGVIRRRPDLKINAQKDEPARLHAIQLELLNAAAEKVASGGKLIYSVCSFLDEEGPEVISEFLKGCEGGFRTWAAPEIPNGLARLSRGPGGLRLWPHIHGTDGFYYGLLARM